jgi:hypothetical protein
MGGFDNLAALLTNIPMFNEFDEMASVMIEDLQFYPSLPTKVECAQISPANKFLRHYRLIF